MRTPGEWRCAGSLVLTNAGRHIALVLHDLLEHKATYTASDHDRFGAQTLQEHIDNGRLISAAPDLLEALREAETVIRWAAQESAGRVKAEIVGGWIHHADNARAAIAKAEGRCL